MGTAERLKIAQTWFDWVQDMGGNAQYQFRSDRNDEFKAIMGYFVQSCAENPEDFTRAFEPLLGPDHLNPLTRSGEETLSNLIANGIGDDWEIFLQWRDSGYVVVGMDQRQPQDARLGVREAIRLLDIISGGQARAPGIANEAAWVQSMYETEIPHHTQ